MQPRLIFDDIPPYASCHVKQELILNDLGKKSRTINGDLINLSTIIKFSTKISCTDDNPIGLHAGMRVRTGCIAKIFQKKAALLRPAHGEITAWSNDFKMIGMFEHRQDIPPETFILSYRPWIVFYINKFCLTACENDKKCTWYLEGEEI